MVTVGITGGIGSGKSTVCRIWSELGAEVLDADQLAKTLMTDSPEIRERIIEEFGQDAYGSDGALNRAFLAREAFEKGRVELLNSIVHPVVKRETRRLIEEARKQGVEMYVKEAALLLDAGRPEEFDFIVLVTAGEDQRVRWVVERDQTESEAVRDRISRQKPTEELLPLSDFVIENDGSLQRLRERSTELYHKMKRLKRERERDHA